MLSFRAYLEIERAILSHWFDLSNLYYYLNISSQVGSSRDIIISVISSQLVKTFPSVDANFSSPGDPTSGPPPAIIQRMTCTCEFITFSLWISIPKRCHLPIPKIESSFLICYLAPTMIHLEASNHYCFPKIFLSLNY